MALEGGCLCGAIRIRSTGEIVNKGLCHCLDCRKITGSTHSTNIVVPSEGFSVTKGSPKQFLKTADSGNTITLSFCGECGSTLWSQSSSFGNTKVIKVGVLDNDRSLEIGKPAVELFVKTRTSWLLPVDGAVQYEASI
ncbi:unnamed protein product [Discula destructiva]